MFVAVGVLANRASMVGMPASYGDDGAGMFVAGVAAFVLLMSGCPW